MCGCPKRSPERSRKMADGKPAFLGKCFQFYLAVQVLLEQFHNAASLPRCQTAFELRNSFRSLTILRDKVRTNGHGERIHEQLREHLRPIQAWQNQLFMDSLTMTICSHLVAQYGQTPETISQFKGGLAPWQRRRVVELFKEHLDGEVKLETLAEECRLSVSHFARSFRRSFGTSAHRYLILQRVEIAKGLLSETNSSLVEIAAQAGFSDQAALTRTFANVVGATPAKWRRENSSRRIFIETSKGQSLSTTGIDPIIKSIGR